MSSRLCVLLAALTLAPLHAPASGLDAAHSERQPARRPSRARRSSRRRRESAAVHADDPAADRPPRGSVACRRLAWVAPPAACEHVEAAVRSALAR